MGPPVGTAAPHLLEKVAPASRLPARHSTIPLSGRRRCFAPSRRSALAHTHARPGRSGKAWEDVRRPARTHLFLSLSFCVCVCSIFFSTFFNVFQFFSLVLGFIFPFVSHFSPLARPLHHPAPPPFPSIPEARRLRPHSSSRHRQQIGLVSDAGPSQGPTWARAPWQHRSAPANLARLGTSPPSPPPISRGFSIPTWPCSGKPPRRLGCECAFPRCWEIGDMSRHMPSSRHSPKTCCSNHVLNVASTQLSCATLPSGPGLPREKDPPLPLFPCDAL